MIVRTIEILLEYLCIILCIHRLAGKKVKIDRWVILLFAFELVIVFLIDKINISRAYEIFVFIGIFAYIKKKVVDSWSKTIEVYGATLINITVLQMLMYWGLKILKFPLLNTQYGGIFINFINSLIIWKWKKTYIISIVRKLRTQKSTIIILLCILSLSSLLFVYNSGKQISYDIAVQFMFGIIGLSIVSIWWISAENENRHKTKELRMYESYNQAFEEAIKTIRTRQHEFENHINAIRCLQYTIKDHEELIIAQEKYCKKVLEENSINKLLSLNLEPILVGFLYSKITEAQGKSIHTIYDIHANDIAQRLELYELIELLGIFFDNAVEALEDESGDKCIILKIVTEENNFFIEISNISHVYTNNEIEKFCQFGYSTKDNKRGVGLTRAKEIIKHHGGLLQIQNDVYHNDNYLSFKITFT